MSWKPSRSSGIMFDKYTRKANENWQIVNEMIESGSYLRFENINKFSKSIYLHWLNDNKAHCALVSRRFDKNKPFWELDRYLDQHTLRIFLRNMHLVYAPMRELLESEQSKTDDIRYADGGETSSKSFASWFKQSKVVDRYGKPLAVYHGSPDLRGLKSDWIFKTSKERYTGQPDPDAAYFFTDSYQKAKSYADPTRAFDYQNAEEGVISVYLSLQNPLIINANGQIWRKFETEIDGVKIVGTRSLIEYAHAHDYDGVIVKNVVDYYNLNDKRGKHTAANVYVAFRKSQIKLTSNTTYDSENDDIRYAMGGKTRKPFGGNSGYVGYSMSRRAEQAYDEGKLTYSKLPAWAKRAVDAGLATTTEWHHTSSYGNQTPFYNIGQFDILTDAEKTELGITDWEDYQDFAAVPKNVIKAIDAKTKVTLKLKNNVKEIRKGLVANAEKRLSDFNSQFKKFTRVTTKPEHGIVDLTEMNGKYGWFNSAGKYYNMTEYYSGIDYETAENRKKALELERAVSNAKYDPLYQVELADRGFDDTDARKLKEIGLITSEIMNDHFYSLVEKNKDILKQQLQQLRTLPSPSASFDPEFIKRPDELLTDREKNERQNRHSRISEMGSEYGSSYERRLTHEAIDREYSDIAQERYEAQKAAFLSSREAKQQEIKFNQDKQLAIEISNNLKQLFDESGEGEQKFADGGEVPFTDKYGKLILWKRGDTMIASDGYGTYFTVWDGPTKKIGSLELRSSRDPETKGYLQVQTVEILPKYRGLGLGTQLYKVALQNISSEYKGIASENVQRSNKKQVPKIYKRLGGKELPSGNILLDKIKQFAKGGTTENQIEKLLKKKSDLESKLFDARVAENNRFSRLGWGSGMRLSKINVSYRRTDALKERIKLVEKQLDELGYNQFAQGGLTPKKNLTTIAKKWNVRPAVLKTQLQKGIKVEMEHTKDASIAAKIALDHLDEHPEYYKYLSEMERNMNKPDIDKHYHQIRNRYARGGTIDPVYQFKTPTGQPSKLDYVQQVLVRTAEFKHWFGDWEKAAQRYLADQSLTLHDAFEGVSMVIDRDTLEPKTVFHGTAASREFFNFDVTMESGTGRPYAYFADNEEYARNFSTFSQRGARQAQGFIYECFLNIRNPFMAIGNHFEMLNKDQAYWFEAVTNMVVLLENANASEQDAEKLKQAARSQIGDFMNDVYGQSEGQFWLMMARDRNKAFKRFMLLHHFDGIRYSEEYTSIYDPNNPAQFTKAWVVFDGRQIKLADGRNLDFDPLNTDIRLEHGGRLNNEPKLKQAAPIEPKMPVDKFHGIRETVAGKFAQGGTVAHKNGTTDNAKDGGLFKGKSHAEGGIKAINTDSGQPLEVEGNEVIINKRSVSDGTKREFEGEMLTNKQILSKINQMGGGVAFADGGEINTPTCRCSGKKYKFGGETLEDYMILSRMNSLTETIDKGIGDAVDYANDLIKRVYG